MDRTMKDIIKIENARIHFKLSKKDMAGILGITPRGYSNWITMSRTPASIYAKYTELMLQLEELRREKDV